MRSVYLLALLILTSTGCIPIARSAKGLKPGVVAVTYHAPLSADIRVGMTEKIEGRFSSIFDTFALDINYHKPVANYYRSITVGANWMPPIRTDGIINRINPTNAEIIRYGGAITYSRNFSGKFIFNYDANPYWGYTHSFNVKTQFNNYFAVGAETRLKFKYIDVLLIPEMQITIETGGIDGSALFGIGLVLNRQ